MDFKITKINNFEIGEIDQTKESQPLDKAQTIQNVAGSFTDSIETTFGQNLFDQNLSPLDQHGFGTGLTFSEFGFEFEFGAQANYDISIPRAGVSPDGYPGEEWLWDDKASTSENSKYNRLTSEQFEVDDSGNIVIKM